MDLLALDCSPTGELASLLPEARMGDLLPLVPGWELAPDRDALLRHWEFPTFRAAMAYVNLVAELADQQDHHPDMDIRYRELTIRTWTHSAGGISLNDFILAARIDLLPTAGK